MENSNENNIKELAKELCEESTCHHKCPTTDDCIVEDEAELLLINENKSNNFEVKSNNELVPNRNELPSTLTNEDKVSVKGREIEKMINIIKTSKGYPSNSDCRKCLFEKDSLYKEVAEILYNAGYRKQSKGEWNDNIIGFCNVCMNCGAIVERSAIKNNSGKLNFCPNCGARMRGEKSE